MLPDIKKGSGIGKTVQVAFGGTDLRPNARDGTFLVTENMTSDKFPLLAFRDPMRAVYTEGHVVGCDLYSMGPGLLRNVDGTISYNNVQIAVGRVQGSGLIPFGNKVILPWSRQILDLSVIPKGSKAGTSALPLDAEEGDAWLLPNQSGVETDEKELWVRKSGSWVNTGPILHELEEEMELVTAIFRSGTYMGEPAVNNTIEHTNFQTMESGADIPDFRKHFRPGDAVTIHSGVSEFDQTLIVREVSATELRFYEYSFPNLVGRYTLPQGGGNLFPGLYKVTGWDRFEIELGGDAPLCFFEIPSGITLTPGMYIEYRFQDEQMNPMTIHHNEAEIKIYKDDGTELSGVTVTPEADYDVLSYPDGPTELLFEETDCGENLHFGLLNVKITKKWPEGIQGLFADSNRLWGWVGHQLRCSKLGDPSNWNFFDGTAEDSWAVDVHNPEPFTGGISAHGYPTFYTEHKRYRIYGSEPESYQLSELDCIGVREGCGKSLCAFNGALYYVSREGIMQDVGTTPVCVSEALGPLRLAETVAGGHQQRYYVTGRDPAGGRHNLILDTRNGLLIDEGSRNITAYAAAGGVMHEAELAGQEKDELTIWARGTGSQQMAGTTEGPISSVAETNDYTMSRSGGRAEPNRVRVHRVQLRFVLAAQAALTVRIRYDGGSWIKAAELSGNGSKRSVYLPMLPRRCDHFALRFEGSGAWELHSLALETRTGSAVF